MSQLCKRVRGGHVKDERAPLIDKSLDIHVLLDDLWAALGCLPIDRFVVHAPVNQALLDAVLGFRGAIRVLLRRGELHLASVREIPSAHMPQLQLAHKHSFQLQALRALLFVVHDRGNHTVGVLLKEHGMLGRVYQVHWRTVGKAQHALRAD